MTEPISRCVRLAASLSLWLLLAACTWSPKVVHPGLGNAGIALRPAERTEIGVSTWAGVVPAFVRTELRVFEFLTLSGGYGLTGPDASGFLGSLNLVLINSSNAYLVVSPNLVSHDNSERGFSALTWGGSASAGLKLDQKGNVRIFGTFFAGEYRGTYASADDRGLVLIPGLGLDADLGVVRTFLEGNLPLSKSIGTTTIMPNLSAGLMFGF